MTIDKPVHVLSLMRYAEDAVLQDLYAVAADHLLRAAGVLRVMNEQQIAERKEAPQ